MTAIAQRPIQSAPTVLDARVARSVSEVEALRSALEASPPLHLDADIDYFLTVVCHRPSVQRPHVMLLRLSDGRDIRIMARLETRRSRLPWRRPVRILRVALGGVTGATTPEDGSLVVEALRAALAAGEADCVLLPQLPVRGHLYRAASSGASWWRTGSTTVVGVHWRLDIPDSMDAFLKARSGKTRSNARYYIKKLRKEHGQDLAIRSFHDPASLDQLYIDMESVAAKTYQRGLGVGYAGDEMQNSLIALAAARGWLRAWVLYLKDQPAAYWLGYSYAGTFWSSANGFDTAYADLRVGQYLQLQIIEELCSDPEVCTFDWGIGDAEYKRRYGDHVTEEADVVIFASARRGAAFNASRALNAALTRLMRGWIVRTTAGARAKKAWRARAEARARRRAPGTG
jgi:CelD/BcsL family acetyltransferase involved in cellulose biosynthesis